MEQGYSAVKIKVGRHSQEDDVRRIQLAMDVAGKGKRVMRSEERRGESDWSSDVCSSDLNGAGLFGGQDQGGPPLAGGRCAPHPAGHGCRGQGKACDEIGRASWGE